MPVWGISVEAGRMEQIVEKAVSQVLENNFSRLREELVRCVLEEIRPQLAEAQAGSASHDGADGLLSAVKAIHAGSTQKEILRALLDATVAYSGRAALFVMKAGM